MKKLMIVPLVGLVMAMFAPAAHASHGGAQSPDTEQNPETCRVAFTGHAICSAAKEGGALWGHLGVSVVGIPTADGWHVNFDRRLIDNETGTVVRSGTSDFTVPYTFNQVNEDELFPGSPPIPLPSRPTFGTSVHDTGLADITCLVDVNVGAGGELGCTFHGHPPTGVPLPV